MSKTQSRTVTFLKRNGIYIVMALCIIATEDVNTLQRKPNNWWKKTDFGKACHVPELPAIINPLKVFGKPWNVKWMTLATSHFKKQQEPLLSILSFITIPNDCIQVSIMPFQTIFSLFYLSTNLDKFREEKRVCDAINVYT